MNKGKEGHSSQEPIDYSNTDLIVTQMSEWRRNHHEKNPKKSEPITPINDTTKKTYNPDLPFSNIIEQNKKQADEEMQKEIDERKERIRAEWQENLEKSHDRALKESLRQEEIDAQRAKDEKKRKNKNRIIKISIIIYLTATLSAVTYSKVKDTEGFKKVCDGINKIGVSIQDYRYEKEFNRYTNALRSKAISILERENIILYDSETKEITIWNGSTPDYYKDIKLESLDDVYIYYSILNYREFKNLFIGNGYKDIVDFLLKNEVIDPSEKDFYKDFTFKDLFDMAKENLEEEVKNSLRVNGTLFEINESNSKGAGRK